MAVRDYCCTRNLTMRCDMELIHREGCISWQTLLLKCTECSMICVRFNGYLSDGTGLAGTRKKLFWILLAAKDDGSGGGN